MYSVSTCHAKEAYTMKRIIAILLSLLLAAVLPAVLAEEQPSGFTLPDQYKVISSQLNRDQLPQDLPADAAVISSAVYSGTSLSVELSAPVPSLAIVQYTDDGETIVRASAENAASLSAENLDDSQGMADVLMTWELAGGTLVSDWTIWEDSSADFLHSLYTTQTEGDQFAPFRAEKREIELDQQMQILSDARILSNDSDEFILVQYYDASGKLTEYSCEWITGADSTQFFLRSSAGQVPTGLSWRSGNADFTALSDALEDYQAGNSLILDTIDYNDSFIESLADLYPQAPEPADDYPLEQADRPAATSTDLTALQGTLWCLSFGPEDESGFTPFATADSLFLLEKGTVVLNADAKDLNGAAPAFVNKLPALPAFELPEIQ